MEKEKECCPECRPAIEDEYECHPWDANDDVDVVELYERIYDKASEITQKDAKLWELDAAGYRGAFV